MLPEIPPTDAYFRVSLNAALEIDRLGTYNNADTRSFPFTQALSNSHPCQFDWMVNVHIDLFVAAVLLWILPKV